jgi:hypothetical protein
MFCGYITEGSPPDFEGMCVTWGGGKFWGLLESGRSAFLLKCSGSRQNAEGKSNLDV